MSGKGFLLMFWFLGALYLQAHGQEPSVGEDNYIGNYVDYTKCKYVISKRDFNF